jgi:hypothetical protein
MPLARIKRGEKIPAEKTCSHHGLPATYRLRNPLQILAGRQSELKLDLVKKVKRIRPGDSEAVARHLNEIVKVSFVNPWCCRRAAPS